MTVVVSQCVLFVETSEELFSASRFLHEVNFKVEEYYIFADLLYIY